MPGVPELTKSEVTTMLKSIIRRAVEATFSTREFEEAVAEYVEKYTADAIDYTSLAENLLSAYDIDDIVQNAAEEYAIDILDLP